MAQIYITKEVLESIQKDVVNIVKSARNYSEITEQCGTSAVYISPIPPDTEPTILEIPLFETKIKEQSAYSNVDQYSGCPEAPMSVTSSMPGPNTMSAYDEDGNLILLTDLSTSECMINAIANGILKRLVKDNKLIFNSSQNRRFNWFIQNKNIKVTFNKQTDYPLYANYQYYKYSVDVTAVPPYTETLYTGSSKVMPYSGYLYLEKYVKIDIDVNNVKVDCIKACNILAYNNSDKIRYSISDYFIKGNELWIKLKTPYPSEMEVEIEFDITIQYLYDELL